MDWKTPSWNTPTDRVDRVELAGLPDQTIVPEAGWPETFWKYVGKRQALSGAEAREVIEWFLGLEPGASRRCHEAPWGLAFYEGDGLLFTATLCYKCHNAYVYTEQGKDLRAFDAGGPNAKRLFEVLKQHLPLNQLV
jgi:hypothetical protein